MKLLKRIASVLVALLPRGLRPSPRLKKRERARVLSAARLEDLDGMPVLYLAGSLADAPMKGLMLTGALLWFVAWPLANREAGG